MYDLTQFDNEDLYHCAIALRNMDMGATSMEEVAKRIVGYLYQHLIDQETNTPACALVRFFKTHDYQELPFELQTAAKELVGGQPVNPATKCLSLLATAGEEPQWNYRQGSTGHQAIPLIDKEFIDRAPMISQLIQQFGLDVDVVLHPTPELLLDLGQLSFNVFYVPDAQGSPYIPAQTEFVKPYNIRSVLGFGGILPSGNLFAVILFTKVVVPPKTARLFKWVSAYVRIAAASTDTDNIFIE